MRRNWSFQKSLPAFIVAMSITMIIDAGSASAQSRRQNLWPDISGSDIVAIKAVTEKMLRLTPEIEYGEWQNPESGSSGEVWLQSSPYHEGRICRELRHVVLHDTGLSDRFTVVRCLHEDGRWLIENE